MEDMTHVHSALMYKCRRHTRYYYHVYLHPGLHLVWGLSYIRCMYNSMTGQWISLERAKTFVQRYINDLWRLLLWNSKVLNQKKTYILQFKKGKICTYTNFKAYSFYPVPDSVVTSFLLNASNQINGEDTFFVKHSRTWNHKWNFLFIYSQSHLALCFVDFLSFLEERSKMLLQTRITISSKINKCSYWNR